MDRQGGLCKNEITSSNFNLLLQPTLLKLYAKRFFEYTHVRPFSIVVDLSMGYYY